MPYWSAGPSSSTPQPEQFDPALIEEIKKILEERKRKQKESLIVRFFRKIRGKKV